MSFFRRPGESSSEDDDSSEPVSDSEEVETIANDVSQNSAQNSVGTIELSENDSASENATEELALAKTISNDEHGNVMSREKVRDMAIVSLLQELSRYKAAEILNASERGPNDPLFTKDSPQTEKFADIFFDKSSSVLERSNILPPDAGGSSDRAQMNAFMTELTRQSQQDAVQDHQANMNIKQQPAIEAPSSMALVQATVRQPHAFQNTQLAQAQQLVYEMDNVNLLNRHGSQLRNSLPPSITIPSQYHTNFKEVRQLGRGGFGIVTEVSHHLDGQRYAVKRVPLSSEQARRYVEHGQSVLGQILHEVQVLARLEHPNIVRYVTAWIDPPSGPANISHYIQPRPRLLLQNRATSDISFSNPFRVTSDLRPQGRILGTIEPSSSTSGYDPKSLAPTQEEEFSHDPFARSKGTSRNEQLLWSARSSHVSQVDAGEDSDIFTDGKSRRNSSLSRKIHDSCFTLNIQMGVYPLTLTDYLQPQASTSSTQPHPHRHCFHLVPALKILLGILCGLQYIHSQGLLHRDIKPSNIFLTVHDLFMPMGQGWTDIGSCPSCPPLIRHINPRIGDFGLVKLQDSLDVKHDGHVGDGANIGTEYYRPPKCERQTQSDEKTDVFALGVILLELLWCCGTKMERINLLKSAQTGQICIAHGLREGLVKEGFDGSVAEKVFEVISGMIHPDSKFRWRCAMVKGEIEEILQSIDSTTKLKDQIE